MAQSKISYSNKIGVVALLGILHSGHIHTVIGHANVKGLEVESSIPNSLGIIAKAIELLDFEDVLLKAFPKPNN